MELRVPAPRVNDIVRERLAVTPDTALRRVNPLTRPDEASAVASAIPADACISIF